MHRAAAGLAGRERVEWYGPPRVGELQREAAGGEGDDEPPRLARP
jgi:hypothetical protein